MKYANFVQLADEIYFRLSGRPKCMKKGIFMAFSWPVHGEIYILSTQQTKSRFRPLDKWNIDFVGRQNICFVYWIDKNYPIYTFFGGIQPAHMQCYELCRHFGWASFRSYTSWNGYKWQPPLNHNPTAHPTPHSRTNSTHHHIVLRITLHSMK